MRRFERMWGTAAGKAPDSNAGSPEEEFLNVVFAAQNELPLFIREKILGMIRTADEEVRSVFFPESGNPETGPAGRTAGRELAVRYAAFILSVSRQRPDLAAKISSASYAGIRNWMRVSEKPVGEEIYRAYLKERLDIPEKRNEQEEYFHGIVKCVTSTAFERVTQAISAVKTPEPAQLIIAALKVLSGRSYNEIILSWGKSDFFKKTFEGRNLFQLLQNYPWFCGYEEDVLSEELSPDMEKQVREHPDSVLKWIESPRGPRAFGLLKL